MEINIQLVSGFDAKSKKGALVYELNLIKDGRILRQRSIDYKEESFDLDCDKNEGFEFLHNRIKEVVAETKEKYDCSAIQLNTKHGTFGLKRGMFDNDEMVRMKSIPNPLPFKSKMQKLYSLMFNPDHIDYSNIQKEKNQINKAMERQNHRELNEGDIGSFLKRLTAKQEILKKAFDKNVLNNKHVEDVFINIAFISAFERKRYGYAIEMYRNEKDFKVAERGDYREMNVSLGEHSDAVVSFNKELIEKIKKMKNADKRIIINEPPKDTFLFKDLKEQLRYNKLENSVTFTQQRTALFKKTKHFIDQLIAKDVNLHLKKLKDPNTVAIFTDGSVNKKERISGSGFILKHQNYEISKSFTTEQKADSTYAEYRAVKEALTEIAKNTNYEGKEIVLVSDKDSIASNIKKYLSMRGKSTESTRDMEKTEPFLKDICDIIKHFDLEDRLYFHNVKSHLHDKVKELDKDKYYDFYYNNKVDEVARAGAKLRTKDEVKKDERKRYKERRKARMRA